MGLVQWEDSVISSCSKYLFRLKNRYQCFSIHIPEEILQSLHRKKAPLHTAAGPRSEFPGRCTKTALASPAVRGASSRAPARALSGQITASEAPMDATLSKDFFREHGNTVQVFLQLSHQDLQPVTLCRELVSASLKWWTLSNSWNWPTRQRSLQKWRNHHQKYFQIKQKKKKKWSNLLWDKAQK